MIFRDQLAKTFSRIAKALKISTHNGSSLAHMVQVIREHFHAEICSLYESRQATLTLMARASQDRSLEKLVPTRSTLGEDIAEIAVKNKEAVFDQENAAVPLVYQEKVIGVLTLHRSQLKGFDLPEMQFLEFIALQLAGVDQSLIIAEQVKQQTLENGTPPILRGIPASPGFGIGPALFLLPGIASGRSKPNLSPQHIESEREKLYTALRRTSEDLSHSEKGSAAGIFDSHQLILSDAELLKKLGGEIDNGKSALEAVGHILQEYVDQFAKMKNSRFEDTAIDLEELKQRIFENLLGMEARREKEDWVGVLVAKSLGPSDTARLDPSQLLGIATTTGGPTSHAAILARSLGIPAVMAVAGIMEKIKPGALLIVDGDKGEVIVNPTPFVLHSYELLEEERMAKRIELGSIADEPAVTLDGHRIHLEANVGFVSDVVKLRHFGAEGIGLFRTEFLFLNGKELPSEDEQLNLYRKIIEDAKGLPITFRVLDAGGDKPMEALPMEKEENPFLGCRSIRLTLSYPHILKTQLRALLRASAFGSVRLLIPMVSGMEEVDAIKEILGAVKKELSQERIRYDRHVPFGIMIEVPSSVPMAPLLIRHVDFLSIGTNDLTQYTLAVDRNNERVASFFESLHPAMLAFIAQVASAARNANKPVSICGEMASDPLIIPLLVGLGISSLSMIPLRIPEAKKVIRQLHYKDAQKMAKQALQASRIQEIKDILANFRR